ncbi:hypothetical protein CYMTET_39787 [Cymbomonas tetramitiformis]|uniref:Uncharacterized protein n=1 Tax=Cymbomonas tetramitiformis TaxID=36881 RepID=A0AAE0F3M0_9CHLO|nr:hypothetical protein CYMTET_39787 [Cymbomonas tetramitiformis]
MQWLMHRRSGEVDVVCVVRSGLGEWNCSKERFYAWFDINLSEEQSKNYLNYLIDGLFIDQNTEQLTVQLITYNADLQYFGNAILTFNFNKESGGTIRIVSKVQTISIEMYNDDAGKVRGAFEVVQLTQQLEDLNNSFAGALRRAIPQEPHFD